MYRMQKKILAYGGRMMRYEQLKSGAAGHAAITGPGDALTETAEMLVKL